MTRRPTYRWRLRDLMAEHDMFATTALLPLLDERGIDLSPSQVHRLVTQAPERLSLPVLAALCDIFACTPADLIVTDVQIAADRKASGGGGEVLDLATTGRPRRARVRRDE
ncbi:DNA-binding Xre family transcriptional regulator [Motilibacter peucedani]|uniref:DNA-binding Xre family transcriptional regulator n=1 Tax=Motilibacter peucedani TaxID=598650 RepID=A0A420XSU6_9ACTN|nr:helix-turn-helix transcriptional regulator [Motilibacter peucedani]RKS77958.1 DNA-binding Xre family transcriptional regulator [Motilibacter peucedani]